MRNKGQWSVFYTKSHIRAVSGCMKQCVSDSISFTAATPNIVSNQHVINKHVYVCYSTAHCHLHDSSFNKTNK